MANNIRATVSRNSGAVLYTLRFKKSIIRAGLVVTNASRKDCEDRRVALYSPLSVWKLLFRTTFDRFAGKTILLTANQKSTIKAPRFFHLRSYFNFRV